ncbi:MAG: hypothetical protein NDJ89_04975 [Oligoflexia bacterium]|nr:hypothetical protein [Oligoflexia bacterium]
MSNEKSSKATNETYFAGLQGGVTDSLRELMGLQFRSAQAMMDKSISLGQSYTEFVQTQMNEGFKLSQEALRHGWTMAETIKKSAYDFTDRALRNPLG